MVAYPDGNPGIYPLDPETEVGQFRLIAGDTSSEPYEPEVDGVQTYKFFSDAEIAAFLIQGGTLTRAIGYGYLQLASAAALKAKSIKDNDLQVDLTKRSSELRAIAQTWFDRADGEDDAGGESDIFDVFDLVAENDPIAEDVMPVYGRVYTWDRIR